MSSGSSFGGVSSPIAPKKTKAELLEAELEAGMQAAGHTRVADYDLLAEAVVQDAKDGKLTWHVADSEFQGLAESAGFTGESGLVYYALRIPASAMDLLLENIEQVTDIEPNSVQQPFGLAVEENAPYVYLVVTAPVF